jgi:hypothetical protein
MHVRLHSHSTDAKYSRCVTLLSSECCSSSQSLPYPASAAFLPLTGHMAASRQMWPICERRFVVPCRQSWRWPSRRTA